jgi:hypothetical protein
MGVSRTLPQADHLAAMVGPLRAQRFAENDIDSSVLPELTNDFRWNCRVSLDRSHTVDSIVFIVFCSSPLRTRSTDNAWRRIGEAKTLIETTKESWCEAEIHRIAGEIAQAIPAGPDMTKPSTWEIEHAVIDTAARMDVKWLVRRSGLSGG